LHRTKKGEIAGSVIGMPNCKAEAPTLHELEEKLRAELVRQLKETRFITAIDADELVGVHFIEVSV
jgi:thiol-disulfide isomerase/thioredoxin